MVATAVAAGGGVFGQTDSARVAKRATLSSVQVSSARASAETPLTVSNLDRERIADNRTDASLPYIIEMQPSVVASGENGRMGNASFRMRGVDGTRINVNINGIPLNDAESQMVYWVNIPNLAGMARNIQLQRGVTAATGGSSSFGGALNLETFGGRGVSYASADFSLGSWNTRQYTVSVGTGTVLLPQRPCQTDAPSLSFDMAYSGLTSDGFVRGGFCDHQSLFLTGAYASNCDVLRAVVILGRQHTGITWDGASAEDLDRDPAFNGAGSHRDAFGNLLYYDNESDNYRQNHFQLHYTHWFAPTDWTLNAAFDCTAGEGYYEQYGDDLSPSTFGLGGAAPSDFVTRKFENGHAFTGSLSARYDTPRLRLTFGETYLCHSGDHFGSILWSQDTALAVDHFEWYRNKGLKHDATTFVRAHCYLVPNLLNLYADMQCRMVDYRIQGPDDDRVPMDFRGQYRFFNPKVGCHWVVRPLRRGEGATVWSQPSQTLYLVAGTAHREPARADIKDAAKEPHPGERIRPERMFDIEGGYKIGNERFSASANLYAMIYRDQLTATGRLSTGGYPIMENVDRSYRVGLEIEAGAKVTRRWDIAGNLTLSRNRILDYDYSYYTTDAMGNATRHVLHLGSTDLSLSPQVTGAAIVTSHPLVHARRGEPFKLQFVGKYVGEMYCDNTSRPEMLQPGYLLINLKLGYKWQLPSDVWLISSDPDYYTHDGSRSVELQLVVNNLLDSHYRLNAWVADAFDSAGACTFYRGYYQQPGRNYAVRLVINL